MKSAVRPPRKQASMKIRTDDYEEFQQFLVERDLKVAQLFHEMLEAFKQVQSIGIGA